METLIEAVRQRPCLWNVSSKDYRNPDKKEAAWRSIVDDLKWAEMKDVKDAKAEWKKLRDNHRDSVKRTKSKFGEEASKMNTWKYAGAMEFLLPHMKKRYRSSHSSSNNTQSPTRHTQEDEDTNDDSLETSTSLFKNEPSSDTVAEEDRLNTDRTDTRKRKVDSDPMENSYHDRQERNSRREIRETEREKHSMDLFLESMAITIKTMPSWMQTRVKRKIFAIVCEAEDELDY